LIAVSIGSFWYLLPRNGQEHRLVRNTHVGSSITIVILSGFTFGVVLLMGALF
jgi:hypothetical protein